MNRARLGATRANTGSVKLRVFAPGLAWLFDARGGVLLYSVAGTLVSARFKYIQTNIGA
jgi:hypothetical protein